MSGQLLSDKALSLSCTCCHLRHPGSILKIRGKLDDCHRDGRDTRISTFQPQIPCLNQNQMQMPELLTFSLNAGFENKPQMGVKFRSILICLIHNMQYLAPYFTVQDSLNLLPREVKLRNMKLLEYACTLLVPGALKSAPSHMHAHCLWGDPWTCSSPPTPSSSFS